MKPLKKRNKFLLVSFVILMTVAWALLNVTFAAEVKPIVLRFAEDEPAPSMFAKTRVWWASEIEKRTGGRLKIEIYPGGTLAKGPAIIESVRTRLADGGTMITVFHPGKTPLATVGQNPVGSSNLYANYMAMQELLLNYAPLQQELAKFHQKALWSYASGTQRLIAKKPLPDLSAIRGLKIRATAQMASLIGKLGGSPVFIPMGETYEGLQRGTVEGAMAGIAHISPLHFHEVCKHLLMLEGSGINNGAFGTINLDAWKGLPEDIQKVVLEVNNEYPTYLAKAHMEFEEKTLEAFKAAGVTIYTMNPDDKKRLTAVGEEVAKEWTKEMDGKGLPATEILNLLLKASAKYLAEVDAKGYPWAKK